MSGTSGSTGGGVSAAPGTRPITMIGAASGSAVVDEHSPWPGLASYDEASREYFRGREADAAELLRLIKLSPFVTFYGKSGLGKSSVLQAGVFQPLRDAHFLPVHLRLDYAESAQKKTPLLEQAALRLRQEMAASGADAAEPEPGESLWAYLQRSDTPIWGADNYPLTPVLVFDQFEEVFSRGGSPEHLKSVLVALADFVAGRVPHEVAMDPDAVNRLDLQTQRYHVVLAFRSDFLAEVEAWIKRTNLPRPESLHLTAMSRDSAVRAVKAGAAVLEPGVAEQIVDFLLQREVKGDGTASVVVSPLGGDVEPALLSLCCYQLNRKRLAEKPPKPKIDAELLQTVGPTILADFYREAVKGMPPRVPQFIEDNLILGERYRYPYPRDEALRSGSLTETELDQLTKNRLLRLDPQGDDLRIELIHDRLVGVVRESRDARHASEAQEAERAAQQKQQRDTLERLEREREAAEQRLELERERARAEQSDRDRAHEAAEQRLRLERETERAEQNDRERARVTRWRNRLVVAVMAMVALSGVLIWQRNELKEESRRANGAIATLTETEKSLNERLVAAEADRDKLRLDLEQTRTRWANERLALAEAEEKKNATAAATAARMLAEAQAQQQAAEARRYEASRQVVGNQSTYTIEGWRLASNGCGKGTVSVSGRASFIVLPSDGNVEVREIFDGSGDDFEVTIDSKETFPAKSFGCYDLPTTGTWKGPAGRSFKTQGIDRVCVNKDGKPISATISRIRTDCGY